MTDRASVTIAAAAYPVERIESLTVFKDKLARWVAAAATGGAELLVFPEYGAMELAAIGGIEAAGEVASALARVSSLLPEVDALHADLARHHDVHIIAASGPVRGSDGRFHNRARIFAPNGRSSYQDKLILTPWEREWGLLAAGTHPRVFETALGSIAVPVCYDSEFPLLVRACVDAGAEIIAIPACTDARTGHARVRTAALARALESQCVTALAPLVGEAPWCPVIDRSTGAAGIFTPADRGVSGNGILAEGKLDQPGWVIHRVDLGVLRDSRVDGEVRTRVHWKEQPGAQPLGSHADVVALI